MKKYIGLIIGLLPLIASSQLVMNGNFQVVISPGTMAKPTTLVLTNKNPAGITNNGTGWIISENEFSQVQWNIGTTVGTYVVPFGYSTTDYIPLTYKIDVAPTGSGMVRFSTYHTATALNSAYKPSDVTTCSDFGNPDYSGGMVDRFWDINNVGYSSLGRTSTTFTYIRSGGASEIAAPNRIVEADLIAQRFNTTLSRWDDYTDSVGTDITAGNTGTVKTGQVKAADFFRSWTLANDSDLLTSVPVVINAPSTIVAYPNPGTGMFTVSGLTQGQVIELYNDIGQKLTSAVVDNATMNFNLSNKANGVYFMRVQNKDGSLATSQKIVKMQ